MPPLVLQTNALSFGLLALAAVAYSHWRRTTLAVAAALFFPVTAAATLLTWWPVSAAAALCVLCLGVGVPLVCLGLFLVDLIWAPFCMEMTYLTLWCWVLCPLCVALNYVGMAVRALG